MKYEKTDIGNVWAKEQEDEFWKPFEFKTEQAEEAWKLGFENQGEGTDMGSAYGRCCYVFAARWARRMENAISDNVTANIGDFAEQASNETGKSADMGISGFQYGMIVSILSSWWRYGEDLRRWHNGQYDPKANDKPGAVVNPALLTVSLPDE